MTYRYSYWIQSAREEERARRKILRWLYEPMSQVNRTFRMESLGKAFGLGVDYIYFWSIGRGSFGGELVKAMGIWVRQHKDLNLNNTEYESHPLADVKD